MVFSFTVALMFLSCGKESSCFKSTGKIIKEERSITSGVTEISIEDNIDLLITQSSNISLVVEGGENLLPYINTDISGSQLTISSDNKCSFFRDYSVPLTVYLSLPNLTKIAYTGKGNISSANGLNFPDFTLETTHGTGSINLTMNSDKVAIYQHTGPADFTIKGTTNYLYLYSGGNGWFYLDKLEAEDVHTNNRGSGDMIVKANKSLLVELTSLGNIEYYGNPDVTVSVHSGSGKLIKK